MSQPHERVPGFVVDVILALASLVFLVWGSLGATSVQPDARALDVVGYSLLVVASLALLVMHSSPEGALLVSAGASAAYFVAQYAYGPSPVPTLIALSFAIARGRRSVALAVAGAIVLLPLAGLVLSDLRVDVVVGFVLWLAAVTIVVLSGEGARGRRAYATALEHRALEAERTREEEARRRANDERLSIARDLHDVAAHTVSVIALQAAVASEAADGYADCPEEIRKALRTIRAASRQTMAEIRASIGVLRTADDDQPLSPMLGRAQLDTLIESATRAGVHSTLNICGRERPLPPAVDVTLYRVAQESLTNVLRHAHAENAEVTLTYEHDQVRVRVVDDGMGAVGSRTPDMPTGTTGHGLAGMAERARTTPYAGRPCKRRPHVWSVPPGSPR